ncbi:MAG: methyltransferase domain-containing protein, partial [Pseudomonadales bacterium]|nr:methyltransferase domain-containing protein [Pseudomonadales bacterium]
TVELLNEHSTDSQKALDLGCAVGRASFELARNFERVIGLDYSDAFIDAAEFLRINRQLGYSRWDTGRHRTDLIASIESELATDHIDFVQGDAANLDAVPLLQSDQAFDAVLLSNLLCRLSNPQDCLAQFVESDRYLKAGGVLVIASPNTWMEEYTAQDNFLDGANSDGTLQAIGGQLPGFELLHKEDLPFMIREHRRKYEYIVSQVSVWRKT